MSKTVLIQGMGPQGLKPALQRVVETWPLLADCEAMPKDVISLDVRIHPNGEPVIAIYVGGESEEKG